MSKAILTAAVAALALAGCGGGSSSTQSASSAPAASEAPAAQATIGVSTAENAPVTTMPVYPGATKSPMQVTLPTTVCGHKMTLSMYRVAGASADAVGDWYAGKLAGSTEMKNDVNGGPATSHHVMVISADGSQGATVMELHLPAAMAKYAAKMPSGGGTMLALATYDPGFSPAEIDLYSRAFKGDKAAKAQAVADLKTKCGKDFKLD